jgi:HK97 gp10 family phage protein
VANVRGHQKLVRQFKAIADESMVRAVGVAMFAAGEVIEDAAKGSIMAGSISGKNHVPSKPGEPPNNDTHVLHNNIETIQHAPLLVEVSSNAPYSVPLEFGTSKMAARPFMGPAARASKQEALSLINQAIKAQLRKAVKK